MTSAHDAVPAGVLRLSETMRILGANRTMAELVGRPPDELVGQSIDVVLSGPSRILFQTHVFPALKSKGRVEEMFLTLATEPEPLPVLFNAALDREADPPGYDVIMVRVRARIRWEQDLLAATRALERERTASRELADQLAASARELEARYAEAERIREFREAFIGVVSHELRTPITTIYGMSSTLRGGHAKLPASVVKDRLADIESEADRLRRLTEDLLVLSRAEGGHLIVGEEPVSVARVVRASVDGEQARAPDHRLVAEVAADLPLVRGEHLYVEQVVRNLLGNAIKYSPAGTTITTLAAPMGDGAEVRILDEGPGLGGQPPDRLFELFFRSPDAVRRTGGAGIGLFVCRQLVTAMGGRIWAADRTTGVGAEFGFWLPALEHDSDD